MSHVFVCCVCFVRSPCLVVEAPACGRKPSASVALRWASDVFSASMDPSFSAGTRSASGLWQGSFRVSGFGSTVGLRSWPTGIYAGCRGRDRSGLPPEKHPLGHNTGSDIGVSWCASSSLGVLSCLVGCFPPPPSGRLQPAPRELPSAFGPIAAAGAVRAARSVSCPVRAARSVSCPVLLAAFRLRAHRR